MSDPWFDGIRWGWLPGTAMGVFGGLFGTLAGILGHRAGRALIVMLWVWLFVSIGLLLAGVVALSQGQPYGVWYGLLLPGVLGTTLAGCFLAFIGPALARLRREDEERRIQARDLG